MTELVIELPNEIAGFPRSKYGILEPSFRDTRLGAMCYHPLLGGVDASVKANIHALDEAL